MTQPVTLAEKRKALNLSQEQLAALLGVTQGTVSRNETASEPEPRFGFSLDALAMRKQAGENLAAAADAKLAELGRAKAA